MIAWWMLLRRVMAGLAVAHLGGLLLLALAVAVEAPPGGLADAMRLRVPSSWALAGSVLTVLGAALAAARVRTSGVLLGLGTLGVSPARLVQIALLSGGLLGAGVGAVRAPEAAELGWTRVSGGWVKGERQIADVAGEGLPAVVGGARPVVPPAVALATGGVAGATGALLGLAGGPVGPVITAALALIAEAVCQGLVERGALPELARFAPAALLTIVALGAWFATPLFPRRR